jgi:hypothetical protein
LLVSKRKAFTKDRAHQYRKLTRSVLLNLRLATILVGKGKAVPLQAWSGPEGSRKLRFPEYMTTAQDGGKVSIKHRPPLPLGNAPGAHFG